MSIRPLNLHTFATLRTFPRAVWILFFGTFLNKFGTFVIPFLALYLTRQGYSTREAGAALGAYGVGQLLASICGGHLADSIGRRKTIVLSMFAAGAAMLMLSQARGLPAILLLTLLTGLTGELYRPANSAMLADLVPSAQRVTAFATYRLSFNAGWAFGPAAAGFLAGYSFFWLFLGDAFSSVLFGLVAWACLPKNLPVSRPEAAWSEAWRAIKTDRAFQRAMVSNFAIALVFLQMSSSYGLHVTSLGYSDKIYGFLLSLNGLLVVCCELPITEMTRRYPARWVMAVGYLGTGGGFALNAFAHTLPALVGAMVLFSVGEMITFPVFSAHVADLAPPHLRGRYMGVWGLTSALALILGPTLGMTLFRKQPDALWLAGAGLGLLAASVISVGNSAPASQRLPLSADKAEPVSRVGSDS